MGDVELSVVVPTLNARDRLAACLDAVAEHAPDAEVIVVNGPSADGTTGMVRERAGVAVLVELPDRRVTAARNAGIEYATGDAVAFVGHRNAIAPGWRDALAAGLDAAAAVTGPTRPEGTGDTDRETPESDQISAREVAYLNPGNAAVRATALDELDGFDESLAVGGCRDLAHRLAGNGFAVDWRERMRATRAVGADGGERTVEWGTRYRALAYTLVKNYGLRPGICRRLLGRAGADALAQLRQTLRGEGKPSAWLGNGRAVVSNLLAGTGSGLLARRRDRTDRRNPAGRSARLDRAVTVYDWR
jgi:glycosyltransferase involved in cell wall biosynthesis